MFVSQIFKSKVSVDIFRDFLEKTCEKTDNGRYYIFSILSYKKMLYHHYETDFLAHVIEHYHASKTFYVLRELTYNSMTNIIRQIGKSYRVKIESKIKYADSKYTIEYYIPVELEQSSNCDNITMKNINI